MSEAVWRTLAQRALGGAPIETLTRVTPEGLRIAPLYPRSLAAPWPAPRARTGPWGIVQRVDHPDAEEANRLALLDLEGGATALALVTGGETARGFGLPVTAEAFATALEGVELDLIALRLDAGGRTVEAARHLAAITTARRLTSAALDIDLGLDPIGYRARIGAAMPGDLFGADLAAFLATGAGAGFAGHAFLADGRPYHEAGAGEAQELAAVLATGLAYLKRLEGAGVPLAEAADEIAALLVADADIFVTIAKFRALRRLWAGIEAACGLAPRPLRLHAETAWRMMTRRDPWTNVMRATAAAFAAGIGGADMVAVLPFTLPLGLPEDGARRLARNTGLVLIDEAHLAKVEDPAAGSGGIEGLTEALCARAWALFQAIERDGGIEASLEAGTLQTEIAETAARRTHAIATMARPITGTSAFPTLAETSPALADAPRQPVVSRGPLALPTTRDAEPFELLRDRADAMEAAGRRPTVVLATLGSPAAHGPRALFAATFFAAGGIATQTLPVDAGCATYDPAATPVVCVCAPDETAAEAVRRLREAGARRVLLAGKPALADRLGDALVDGFVHQGCDMLSVLSGVLSDDEAHRTPN